MQINMRRETRWTERQVYDVCWHRQDGTTCSLEARGIDLSQSGARMTMLQAVAPGMSLYLQAQGDGTLKGYSEVRHCTPYREGYAVGVSFHDDAKLTVSRTRHDDIDYYAFLQVNPKSDWPTIHRIYRIMASRFHPDNPETGDVERFLILQAAYDTLSNSERRAAYDASLLSRDTETLSIFELSEFVNGVEGERNRRLGVLSLLYNRRRTCPHSPGISLLDLEKRMGIPREYLEFTTWYLKSKLYVLFGDNSDLVLTVQGVDFVESNCTENSIIQKVLESGQCYATGSRTSGSDPGAAKPRRLLNEPGAGEGLEGFTAPM